MAHPDKIDRNGIAVLDTQKKKKKLKRMWQVDAPRLSMEELHKRQAGLCFYCFQPMPVYRREPNTNRADGYTRDHFYPKSEGYIAKGNTVLACFSCNSGKADRMPTPEEVYRYEQLYGIREN